VLVLRPGALGDTLLALPAIRALRRSFAPITLAAHPGAARLLASLGEIDRGVGFDDPALNWLFTTQAALDEPVVAWLTPEAAAPALKQATVVAPSRPANQDEHCARYLVRTLSPLGIELTFNDRPLQLQPIVSREVLVHPGSGSAAKNWPPERFAQVIRALDAPVRLIVGEADLGVANAVEAKLGYKPQTLELPRLEELAARLAGCRAYLGNDSGVSHLAGLCGAHSVAMFGPTSPSVWQPLGPDVQVMPFEASPATVADALLAHYDFR